MATPKPDTEGLLNEINSLVAQGKIISPDGFVIQRLRQRVKAQKEKSYAWFHALNAALSCLTGDLESMHDSGRIALSLESRDTVALNHVTTLGNAGLFSAARELFLDIDAQFLKGNFKLLESGIECFSFERFVSLAEEMGATTQESYVTISKAHQVLDKSGVSEEEVTRMLDIAGAVLREHGFLASGVAEVYPYPSHGTVTISLPVSISAEEVAELEWEFCQRLFSEYPDAPVHIAQVGFCVGRSA